MSITASRGVVVTGIGAITPLGNSLQATWQACRGGQGAVQRQLLDPGETGPTPFEVPLALIREDPAPALEAALGRRIGASVDPFALYALVAATEAVADAQLDRSQLHRAGVVFGHGIGGMHTLEASYERFYGRKSPRLHPLTVPKIMVNSPTSAIAMEFGAHGPSFAVASACASSGHAISQAAMLIEAGLADIVVTGGSDAIATPCCIASWSGLRAMSPTTCRPFSVNRDGMAIGEGGAALVLESREHARRRNARVHAELAGFGMSSDANHWTQPDLEGATSCIRMACGRAGILGAANVLISTHGTGTPLNDRNEAQAIRAAFGERAMSHPVIATKSSHGHLIGASSAVQAAVALCAMKEHVAPPILNFLGPDPECELDLVLGEARAIASEFLLVNSFSFGGLNSSLVFRAVDE
ncbi:MAG TPA: beta-ketoacyl-[acyl-carrier-protein] synthase family protein [Steroidobacteraceae bacterium]|nr:beta-ketoacyl-[acyl-carrier-protein] synthase family protein [Steroidobacteraceae bacterium]